VFFPPLPPEASAPPCSAPFFGGIVTPLCTAFEQAVAHLLNESGVAAMVHSQEYGDTRRYSLRPEYAQRWLPEDDSLGLRQRLMSAGAAEHELLQREIVLCLLHSPVPYVFYCPEGPAAAVRVRRHIVEAARLTALSFDTDAAERPSEAWRYDETTGFTVLPGVPLIDALTRATQPTNGRRYAFSCYRATEYVILLGLARELAAHNPDRLAMLQRQWETRAIMSREFHDTFLDEHGSNEAPLPPRFYTPGDRVWFRNPDEASSDATGYEGSWVFYLGGGLFSNFWHPERPYTLEDKCLEIFHWRHGLYHDDAGEPCIDEDRVERRIAESHARPGERAAILARMFRLRDLAGTYADGGCIDRTREHPRCTCPTVTGSA